MNQPEPWEHVSGYRLNADGKAIRYRHPETGYEAYIEAILDENQGVMEFRPAIFDEDGTMVVYPNVFIGKERALEDLRRLMEAYA